jgi:alkyl hydroperoxide reductase subunit AhpC
MQTLVGKQAPDFRLQGVAHEEFKEYALTDHRGKWIVLFFYPLDFTFICPTEITGFSKHYEEFEKLNAVVFGASTDSVHSHKAWLKELGALKFPLLGDNAHALSRDYGVLNEEDGTAYRATFIIDPDGKVCYALVNDNRVGRSVKETLRVLEAFQTGDLCPVEWTPGEKTLGKA